MFVDVDVCKCFPGALWSNCENNKQWQSGSPVKVILGQTYSDEHKWSFIKTMHVW